MLKGLLDPKIDIVFKKIFDPEKHPKTLISFLNAILRTNSPIMGVSLRNTDKEKGLIENKHSRLDVKVETINHEIINVEVQLKNEHNVIKRRLENWSKLHEEQLIEEKDHEAINRRICINILNFKYLSNDKFHNMFRIKDIDYSGEAIGVMEMHFIEIPKLDDESDKKDMLVAWAEFLKDPQSIKVRELERLIEPIKEANNELFRLSNNDKERAIYEMRCTSIREEISALNRAREEGRKIGREQVKMSVALELLEHGIDIEVLSKKLSISIERMLEYKNKKGMIDL